MDLLKRKADLQTAEKQALAQLNAIAGQLQLVEELLAEASGATPPTPPTTEEPPTDDPDKEKDDTPPQKLDS